MADARELEARASRLDSEDPLAPWRMRFELPEGVVYLDGNSLGAMPVGARERLARTIDDDWAKGLIRSWNAAGWIDLPRQAARKIAPLIGADADCVAVCDSTSVNLFKVLAAALALRPGRRKIVTERDNFPTDIYIAEGLGRLLGDSHRLVFASDPDAIARLVDDDAAVLMLSHVNYRTGRMHDMARLTRMAHEAGALSIWDIAHSAGAVELALEASGADMAVGCGYKYLNGGPGAPAFLFVARRHIGEAAQPLTGWFSHREPFAFDPHYESAAGISRFQTGTPPILSLTALDAALDLWREVPLAELRRKSIGLTALFMEAVETLCNGHGLAIVTPRDPAERGSQVSIAASQDGYALMQALIANGVIGDFRTPNILRFGFAPLYNRYADAVRAAATLSGLLGSGAWKDPQFARRATVT